MPTLTLDDLTRAVATAAALRSTSTLVPAGGPGDKVFPPTYTGTGAATYATEKRRIDGRDVDTVLLDSVASQANRMETALEEAWEAGDIRFPLVSTDFTTDAELRDLGRVSALRAPHRIADAILRDSLLDEVPFRYSSLGQSFVDARVTNATSLYRLCPTALVFGVWDSTGPKGGLGAKFQRALVGEIVGIGSVKGVKTSSRIDPLGIEKGATLYLAANAREGWTLSEAEARQEKSKPVPVKGGEGKPGAPSAVNHGNIPPSVDANTGGVTIDEARQVVVLSLPALRRLRFPTNVSGQALAPEARPQAELAARVSLAALALCGLAGQRDQGFDLRSRALLVPTAPLQVEIVPADGGEPVAYALDTPTAHRLLAEAQADAARHGMAWDLHDVRLTPARKLVDLVKITRKKAAAGEGSEA